MEEWKDITGYEGYYQVSNYGRVRSVERIVTQEGRGKPFDGHRKGRILKARKQNAGYYIVWLCKGGNKKAITVHRLVAEAFIPTIEGKHDINHIDGNKENNNSENLEWCTKSENVKHSYKNPKRGNNSKSITCVETGIVYPSIVSAANSVGISRGAITHVLMGISKSAGGYQWKRL